jgi:hypothetical protein
MVKGWQKPLLASTASLEASHDNAHDLQTRQSRAKGNATP